MVRRGLEQYAEACRVLVAERSAPRRAVCELAIARAELCPVGAGGRAEPAAAAAALAGDPAAPAGGPRERVGRETREATERHVAVGHHREEPIERVVLMRAARNDDGSLFPQLAQHRVAIGRVRIAMARRPAFAAHDEADGARRRRDREALMHERAGGAGGARREAHESAPEATGHRVAEHRHRLAGEQSYERIGRRPVAARALVCERLGWTRRVERIAAGSTQAFRSFASQVSMTPLQS